MAEPCCRPARLWWWVVRSQRRPVHPCGEVRQANPRSRLGLWPSVGACNAHKADPLIGCPPPSSLRSLEEEPSDRQHTLLQTGASAHSNDRGDAAMNNAVAAAASPRQSPEGPSADCSARAPQSLANEVPAPKPRGATPRSAKSAFQGRTRHTRRALTCGVAQSAVLLDDSSPHAVHEP